METIHTIAALRARLAGGPRPAFVPTMGSLHEGHLALARAARAEAGARSAPTVASIFVNRLQFAPHEDFDRYPRTLAADAALLEREGIDILFAPDEAELYPAAQTFRVQPDAALAGQLEGHFRPGFFEGVCTVVLKLFGAVQPAMAVFGRKDWQQLVVVQRMVEQFALPIDILAGQTVRAPDGLALSSRNAYLSAAERAEAPRLQATLRHARQRLLAGEPAGRVERDAHDALQAAGWQVDYVAVRGQADLSMPQDEQDGPAGRLAGRIGPLVVLAAARLGATRLIDNIAVD